MIASRAARLVVTSEGLLHRIEEHVAVERLRDQSVHLFEADQAVGVARHVQHLDAGSKRHRPRPGADHLRRRHPRHRDRRGVETKEDLDALSELNVPYPRGFHLARPAPAASMAL